MDNPTKFSGLVFGFALTVMLMVLTWASGVAAEKRVALVIGNSAYEHATSLTNPKNDAEAITLQLEGLGFDVITGIDLTHRRFAKTISQFKHKLEHAGVALFFYAGHGLQVSGHNYLMPIDASLDDETALEFEAVKLRTILALMERRKRTNIVFLDACRDNPLARNLARSMGTRSTAIGRGLAQVESGVGTLITFATQPGNVALDGDGKNSPFTKALVKHIISPGLDVALMIRRVRQDVIEQTGGRQIPWQHSSLTAPFMFKKGAEPKQEPVATSSLSTPGFDKSAMDLAFWQAAKESGTREAYESYLDRFANGTFTTIAQLKLEEIKHAEAEEEKTKKLAAYKDDRQRGTDSGTYPEKKGSSTQNEFSASSGSEKGGNQVASAQPVPGKAEKLAGAPPLGVDPEVSRRQLALDLQSALKDIGCYSSRVDGLWGRGSKTSLERFNALAGSSLSAEEPTGEALTAVRAWQGGKCKTVVKRKPSKRTVNRKKKTVTRKKSTASNTTKEKPSGGSSIGTTFMGSGGGISIGLSDLRLKRDVTYLATLKSGIKVYAFRYIWSEAFHVGVMAQDLLAHHAYRRAVIMKPSGFYAVNYAMLGLKMTTLTAWQEYGQAVVLLRPATAKAGSLSEALAR